MGKPCHMYLVESAFSAGNIALRVHMCTACDQAVEGGCEPGRHCRSSPRASWPRSNMASTGLQLDKTMVKDHRGLGCVMGDTPIHQVPWATDTAKMFPPSTTQDQIKIV